MKPLDNRTDFGNQKKTTFTEFNTLLDKPKKSAKKIEIAGEMDFGNDALDNSKQLDKKKLFDNNNTITSNKRRGRPIKIKDKRYQVNRPKMISPALESKLAVLQDYVEEFQTVSGRITFEKYIDTLVESYITIKLGIAREERLRDELNEALNKLEN